MSVKSIFISYCGEWGDNEGKNPARASVETDPKIKLCDGTDLNVQTVKYFSIYSSIYTDNTLITVLCVTMQCKGAVYLNDSGWNPILNLINVHYLDIWVLDIGIKLAC